MPNARAAILDEVEREMNRSDENAEDEATFEDYAEDVIRRLTTILRPTI